MQTSNTTESKLSKAYKGIAMEGPIAVWYAQITRNDLARHRLIAGQLRKHIVAGCHVLEIAPGPGFFCIELAKLGSYEIMGMDISKSFVEMARRNAAAAGVKVEFQQGNASDMPFATESFDFAFCQAAFKNFTQPIQAIAEMYRVLRPQGSAVIIDLRRDASRQEIRHHIKSMGLNRINELMTTWAFQNMLLKNAYTLSEMETFVAQTQFGKCHIEVDDIGFQVWVKK